MMLITFIEKWQKGAVGQSNFFCILFKIGSLDFFDILHKLLNFVLPILVIFVWCKIHSLDFFDILQSQSAIKGINCLRCHFYEQSHFADFQSFLVMHYKYIDWSVSQYVCVSVILCDVCTLYHTLHLALRVY